MAFTVFGSGKVSHPHSIRETPVSRNRYGMYGIVGCSSGLGVKIEQLGDALMKLNRCQVDRVVPVLKGWVREGNSLTSHGLVHVLDRLSWRKRYLHALMALDWVANQRPFPFTYKEALRRLDLCSRCQHVNRALYLFETLPTLWKTEEAYCVMLELYYRRRMVDEAERLMDELKRKGDIRTLKPFHVMLSLYMLVDMESRFDSTVQEIRTSGLHLDVSFYSILLSATRKFGEGFTTAVALFAEMEEHGVQLDETGLLLRSGIFLENGMLEKSAEALQEVEKKMKTGDFKNVRETRRKLLVMHGKLRDEGAVYRIIGSMDSGKHSMQDYICVISALGSLGRMKEVERLYERYARSLNPKIHNALLNVLVDRGHVARAEYLLEHMNALRISFTPRTYHLILQMYLKTGDLEAAMHAFKRMTTAFKGLTWPRPSAETLAMMVEHYVDTGNVVASERLIKEWMKYSFPVSVKTFNNLLKVCLTAKVQVHNLSSRMLSAGLEPTLETERLLKLLRTSSSYRSEPLL